MWLLVVGLGERQAGEGSLGGKEIGHEYFFVDLIFSRAGLAPGVKRDLDSAGFGCSKEVLAR